MTADKLDTTRIFRGKDLTGIKYGKLSVVRFAGIRKPDFAVWECFCECGKTKLIFGISLTHGNTQSCGCLAAESARMRFKTHGLSCNKKLHPVYGAWYAMMGKRLNLYIYYHHH